MKEIRKCDSDFNNHTLEQYIKLWNLPYILPKRSANSGNSLKLFRKSDTDGEMLSQKNKEF